MFFPGRDSHEHHPGKQTAIRLGHPFRAQPGQLVTQAVRGGYQPDHVHPLADRSYPPQIACSSIQETHCPAKIAVAPVVEGNGQLQRPLVKIPISPSLPIQRSSRVSWHSNQSPRLNSPSAWSSLPEIECSHRSMGYHDRLCLVDLLCQIVLRSHLGNLVEL